MSKLPASKLDIDYTTQVSKIFNIKFYFHLMVLSLVS